MGLGGGGGEVTSGFSWFDFLPKQVPLGAISKPVLHRDTHLYPPLVFSHLWSSSQSCWLRKHSLISKITSFRVKVEIIRN